MRALGCEQERPTFRTTSWTGFRPLACRESFTQALQIRFLHSWFRASMLKPVFFGQVEVFFMRPIIEKKAGGTNGGSEPDLIPVKHSCLMSITSVRGMSVASVVSCKPTSAMLK